MPTRRGEEKVPYWLVKPEPGWRGEELGRAIVRGWLRVCAWKGCQLVLGFAPASITIPWILGAQYYHPPLEYLDGSVAFSPEYLDHGTLWPKFISFCSWREEGRTGGWGLLLISFNADEEIESKLAFEQRVNLILMITNTYGSKLVFDQRLTKAWQCHAMRIFRVHWENVEFSIQLPAKARPLEMEVSDFRIIKVHASNWKFSLDRRRAEDHKIPLDH